MAKKDDLDIKYDPNIHTKIFLESEVRRLENEEKIKNLEKKLAELPIDEPLNIKQTAKFFGVSVSTIRRWAKSGQLPFVSDRPYRFLRSDLQSCLESKKRIIAPSIAGANSEKGKKRDYDKALRNIGLGSKKKKGK